MFKPIHDCLGAVPLPASSPPGEGSVSREAGPFFCEQLELPCVPPVDRDLQEVVAAQRVFMEAWESYDAIRARTCVFNLPELLRRQAE